MIPTRTPGVYHLTVRTLLQYNFIGGLLNVEKQLKLASFIFFLIYMYNWYGDATAPPYYVPVLQEY